MESFKNTKIISAVEVNKTKRRHLSIEQQSAINKKLYNKVMLFLNEVKTQENRAEKMSLFDQMFEETHGGRIKELFKMRKKGKHVVSLFCHSIPPELIYAVNNTVSVSICCGGSELEEHTNNEMPNQCSLSRSMLGFMNTGMCVFHNVADYAINVKACHSFKQISKADSLNTPKFTVINLEKENNTIDNKPLLKGLFEINNEHIQIEKLLELADVYTKIREEYIKIKELRKHHNPPISGKDYLWTLQVYLTTEPNRLLETLKELRSDLETYIEKGIGINSKKDKKRVMLFSARHMPPYAQIFRIIENAGAIVVNEKMCSGISNVNYDIETLKKMSSGKEFVDEDIINYMMANPDINDLVCESSFNAEEFLKDVKDYNIDSVVLFSYPNCFSGELKMKGIEKTLKENNISVKTIITNYDETYVNEEKLTSDIKGFLKE